MQMPTTINKQEIIRRVAARTGKDIPEAELMVDATLEEIYEALKHSESVTLRNFGKFYVRLTNNSTVFKFDPSQRLRAIFGWSSTYKGDL